MFAKMDNQILRQQFPVTLCLSGDPKQAPIQRLGTTGLAGGPCTEEESARMRVRLVR